MRKIFFFLASITILGSCSSDALDDYLGDMSATIDGTKWSTITRVTVQKEDNFIITGTSSSGEVLIITILGTDEGSYDVPLKCDAAYKESASVDLEDAAVATSGSVILSEVNTSDKKISGTFSFNILKDGNTMDISSGVFNDLSYTVSSN